MLKQAVAKIMTKLIVSPVACWQDNYAYVLWLADKNVPVAMIDPVEPAKVYAHIQQKLGLASHAAVIALLQ